MLPFDEALKFTLKWEGGYVNHPADPGGATNQGITQLTYDAWRKSRGLPKLSVKEIAADEVRTIYHQAYWMRAGCVELPWPLALAVFDTAVNLGVKRALWLLDDTREAVTYSNTRDLTRGYITLREQYYRTRPVEKQRIFLKGWLNRCEDLRRVCEDFERQGYLTKEDTNHGC